MDLEYNLTAAFRILQRLDNPPPQMLGAQFWQLQTVLLNEKCC